MFASFCSKKQLNNKYYKPVQLGFPASASDIETIFEQVGIKGPEECKIEFLRWRNYLFASDEIREASVDELNFFSRRVSEMNAEKCLAFEEVL